MSRIIYGIKPVMEALKAHSGDIESIKISSGKRGKEINEIISEAEKNQIPVDIINKESIYCLIKTHKHQGIIAKLKSYRYVYVDEIIGNWKNSGEKALILILDSIQDPHNLGSLIRTAHCLGAHGIIIPKDRSAEVTPTVVKVSAGATEHTLIARVTNLNQAIGRLKKDGVWVIGTTLNEEKSIYDIDLSLNLAVVIGSEGKGIRPLIKKACDILVSIPMKGKVSSLNAAVTGGIVLYEILRRRLQKV